VLTFFAQKVELKSPMQDYWHKTLNQMFPKRLVSISMAIWMKTAAKK